MEFKNSLYGDIYIICRYKVKYIFENTDLSFPVDYFSSEMLKL